MFIEKTPKIEFQLYLHYNKHSNIVLLCFVIEWRRKKRQFFLILNFEKIKQIGFDLLIYFFGTNGTKWYKSFKYLNIILS